LIINKIAYIVLSQAMYYTVLQNRKIQIESQVGSKINILKSQRGVPQ
jgi:hypothetical protein